MMCSIKTVMVANTGSFIYKKCVSVRESWICLCLQRSEERTAAGTGSCLLWIRTSTCPVPPLPNICLRAYRANAMHSQNCTFPRCSHTIPPFDPGVVADGKEVLPSFLFYLLLLRFLCNRNQRDSKERMAT